MKEDLSSDSDYELIQSKGDLKNEDEMENKNILQANGNLGQENEIEDKNVFQKPENQINVEELKQTFQQMIDEIKNENAKQHSVLKEIIEQKNEKIISLDNKVKQMEESTDKKVGEKTEELEQINLNNNQLCFVQLANKWKEIKEKCSEDRWFMDYCCEAKCINTEKPCLNFISQSWIRTKAHKISKGVKPYY
uniref:Uncharacterized protein n=1 Tax=Meloidogyne enterolobii TaxID=390850 RepID=A0A6V7WW64_MELEN|nr:unnamed protein product [Meloidogyne enterolobii]